MEIVRREAAFHHFSHEHPLELANLPPEEKAQCFGCKLNLLPEVDCHCCRTCPFSLHQTCFNMLRKRQHSAHPDHTLSLLVASSSGRGVPACKACGQRVDGFCYYCAICGVSYHALCSTLPPSVAITSHPHMLKLEFSLPYEFRCDLCKKPSYKGWLYRCGLCEFDIHLACAISQLQAERKKEDVMGASSREIMQLLSQKLSGNEVAKWVEVSNSPKVGSDRSGRATYPESNRGELIVPPSISNVEQTRQEDRSPLLSEVQGTPSYQFSDLYFSIDLAKSYSSPTEKHQPGKEATDQDTCGTSKGIEKMNASSKIVAKDAAASKQKAHQLHNENGQGIGSYNRTPDLRMSHVFLGWGMTNTVQEFSIQMEKQRNVNGSLGIPHSDDQSTDSDTGWRKKCWKLLFWCCPC